MEKVVPSREALPPAVVVIAFLSMVLTAVLTAAAAISRRQKAQNRLSNNPNAIDARVIFLSHPRTFDCFCIGHVIVSFIPTVVFFALWCEGKDFCLYFLLVFGIYSSLASEVCSPLKRWGNLA
jgi:hypothetical protein